MIIAAVMMTGAVNANNDSTAVNRKKVAVVLSDRRKQNTYLYSTGLTIGKQDKQGGGIIKGKNLAELFQQRLKNNYPADLARQMGTAVPINADITLRLGKRMMTIAGPVGATVGYSNRT